MIISVLIRKGENKDLVFFHNDKRKQPCILFVQKLSALSPRLAVFKVQQKCYLT